MTTKDEKPYHDEVRASDCFGKALIFSSHVSHARIFPKAHRFAYSYLLVGVPVTANGLSGRIVSADARKQAWLSVAGEDHLERGNATLNDKINDYLRSVGHSRADFPYVYLVCAPKLLGYQFNPASFWYLYDDHKSLKAVLVEVNNTFGERRLYWCPRTPAEDGADKKLTSPHENAAGLRHSWQKDFHVSPFNSRKGSYALSALDPFAEGRDVEQMVDNRITLLSNHGRAKLVARVRSNAVPLDPHFMTGLATFKVVMLWWWVGFATFPRIVAEAAKLYFKHKLPVWFRPEVRATSIALEPTSDERVLEQFFRMYLRDVARKLPGVAVRYVVPFQPHDAPREQIWGDEVDCVGRKRCSIVRVTSPAFYSRMIYYDSLPTMLLREGIDCRDENRTVDISDIQVIDTLLQSDTLQGPSDGTTAWRLLAWLRTSPPAVSYPESQSPRRPSATTQRITQPEGMNQSKPSKLDAFMYQQGDALARKAYLKKLMKLFILKRANDHIGSVLGLLLGLGGVAALIWLIRIEKFG